MWISIENVLNQKIPECVKEILNANGFTSELSLMSINAEVLQNIEDFTNENLEDTIHGLICCHSDTYKSQVIEKQFNFLPGHKALILQIAKNLDENRQKILDKTSSISQIDAMAGIPALSNILKEVVVNAMKNFLQPPTQNRYSETMKYFSMYIYMICGKKSYEVLQANLKLPAVSTISMFD